MSQQQEPSILFYRGLIPTMGLHGALQAAAKDVDDLRAELGRKIDAQSAIRFAFFVAGLCIGIILCAMKGCSAIGHEKVAGWPELRVVENYVPHAAMRDVCAKYAPALSPPEACAEFNLATGVCNIYYSADFPPQAWIVEHERMHCAGYDHIGSTNMRDHLARWRKQ